MRQLAYASNFQTNANLKLEDRSLTVTARWVYDYLSEDVAAGAGAAGLLSALVSVAAAVVAFDSPPSFGLDAGPAAEPLA